MCVSESNVCIGRDAVIVVIQVSLSGGNCTLIGKGAGTTLGSGSNVTCIGNVADQVLRLHQMKLL